MTEPTAAELSSVILRLEQLLEDLKIATEGRRVSKPQPSMVPLKQAAGQTGFSPETIRLWILRGLVKAERRGGRWFVDTLSLADRIRTRSPQAA